MKKVKLAALIFGLIISTAYAEPPHCKGITKAGSPCKSAFLNKSGYCNAHDPNKAKCQGVTKSGKPCGQMPMKGQKYCRFHNQ